MEKTPWGARTRRPEPMKPVDRLSHRFSVAPVSSHTHLAGSVGICGVARTRQQERRHAMCARQISTLVQSVCDAWHAFGRRSTSYRAAGRAHTAIRSTPPQLTGATPNVRNSRSEACAEPTDDTQDALASSAAPCVVHPWHRSPLGVHCPLNILWSGSTAGSGCITAARAKAGLARRGRLARPHPPAPAAQALGQLRQVGCVAADAAVLLPHRHLVQRSRAVVRLRARRAQRCGSRLFPRLGDRVTSCTRAQALVQAERTGAATDAWWISICVADRFIAVSRIHCWFTASRA